MPDEGTVKQTAGKSAGGRSSLSGRGKPLQETKQTEITPQETKRAEITPQETKHMEGSLQDVKGAERAPQAINTEGCRDQYKEGRNVPAVPERRCAFPWKKKELPLRVYIEQKINEGFKGDGLNFVLDCIEEGMSQKEIDEVASPKLPVEVMERLKELKKRKGEAKNG